MKWGDKIWWAKSSIISDVCGPEPGVRKWHCRLQQQCIQSDRTSGVWGGVDVRRPYPYLLWGREAVSEAKIDPQNFLEAKVALWKTPNPFPKPHAQKKASTILIWRKNSTKNISLIRLSLTSSSTSGWPSNRKSTGRMYDSSSCQRNPTGNSKVSFQNRSKITKCK